MWLVGGTQRLVVGKASPLGEGIGADAQNSAFVSAFWKGQIPTGRTARTGEDKHVSKDGKSLPWACSPDSPQGVP